MTKGLAEIGDQDADLAQRIGDEYLLADSPAQLAALLDVPVADVESALSDPASAQRIDRIVARHEREGTALKPLAATLIVRMLGTVREELEAGNLDVSDIDSLLPKLGRLVEHADKIEADRGTAKQLPVFNIVIGSAGISATRVDVPVVPVIRPEASDVIDGDSSVSADREAVGADAGGPLAFLQGIRPLAAKGGDDAA